MASADKADYVWMDGKVIPWSKATIHVSSEAVLRAASIFEGMRAYWSEKDEETLHLQESGASEAASPIRQNPAALDPVQR